MSAGSHDPQADDINRACKSHNAVMGVVSGRNLYLMTIRQADL